jgi:amidohydrolase
VAKRISPDIQALRDFMAELRRDLHRHPEVGFQERRTAEIIAGHLAQLGFVVRTGVGGTGVTGLLRSGRPGRTVLFRTELDALPIQEEVDVPWKSQRPGAMHACGHDANMAMNVAAATVLARELPSLGGSLFVVFQPAEELLSGAAAMLRDGAMEGIHAEGAISVHMDNERPVGTIAMRSGPITTSADRLRIVVKGQGGHGAMPHLAKDPVLAAAHVIVALQSLVSRERSPLEMAVLSLTTLAAGTAFNIIPGVVEMTGTFRCYSAAVRESLLAALRRIAGSVAAALGCSAEVEIEWLTPAMYNDPTITEMARQAASEIVSPGHVVEMDPLGGSDDLAHFRRSVPGCHVFVGSAKADGSIAAPHHNARFDIDESAMEIGADLLVRTARRILGASG